MTIPKLASYPLPLADAVPESRVRWSPDPARAVFLVHDMQRYFASFFANGESPLCEVIDNIRRLREACDACGTPVVYTMQPAVQSAQERGLLSDMWGPGLPAKPDLADIVPELAPRATDHTLRKTRYSAFFGTELKELMRAQGRDQLWISGVYGHIGCMVTAFDAFMNDVKPFLIADAMADFSADHHALALDLVATRCGVALSTQTLLARMHSPRPAQGRKAELTLDLAELLGEAPEQIHPEDNLFDLGLDSVRRMELTERLNARGIKVSPLDVMECESLVALRALIDHAGTAPKSAGSEL